MTQVRDGIYLIDVLTRATDEERLSLATLRSLQIPLPNGRTVPLSQIATFDFAQVRVVPEENEIPVVLAHLVLDVGAERERIGHAQFLVMAQGHVHDEQGTLDEAGHFASQDIEYRKRLAGAAAETRLGRVAHRAVLRDAG